MEITRRVLTTALTFRRTFSKFPVNHFSEINNGWNTRVGVCQVVYFFQKSCLYVWWFGKNVVSLQVEKNKLLTFNIKGYEND